MKAVALLTVAAGLPLAVAPAADAAACVTLKASAPPRTIAPGASLAQSTRR